MGLLCLFAYPLFIIPIWLFSGRKSVQKWGANQAISVAALFMALTVLNWAAAIGVALIPPEVWDAWLI